jgi:ammonium transporter, Amt family
MLHGVLRIGAALALGTGGTAQAAAPAISGGDTAWMLISTVLVTLMVVPGIALFYAGMVRRKNALATTAYVLGSAAVVTLAWLLVGYSLAFTTGNGWIGGLHEMMLEDLVDAPQRVHALAPTIPESVFALFQLTFAMVTVALVFGAVVERMRFGIAMAFAALWTVLVYAPVAHWVWHPDGWLHRFGHLDFAGGTVVHLASGTAGLVLAAMVGPRRGYGSEPMAPHNLMLTTIGAGLLWVGWFGFNGGSAFGATHEATRAVLVTQAAAACGVLAWLLCEWLTRGQVTLLGLASGLVAGLIAVTPASGFVGLPAAMLIGAVGAVACFFAATALKARLGYDDSLDVFGMHGVAGLLGTILTGAFQRGSSDPLAQTGTQAIGALAVMLYVAVMTAVIAIALRSIFGLRVAEQSEREGLDLSQHGESLSH